MRDLSWDIDIETFLWYLALCLCDTNLPVHSSQKFTLTYQIINIFQNSFLLNNDYYQQQGEQQEDRGGSGQCGVRDQRGCWGRIRKGKDMVDRRRLAIKLVLRIQIRIRNIFARRLKIELWRFCRPLVADSHQFDEEQDPDPYLSFKVVSGSAL